MPTMVGARVLRKEDPNLLTGRGGFLDDLAPPGWRCTSRVRPQHRGPRPHPRRSTPSRPSPSTGWSPSPPSTTSPTCHRCRPSPEGMGRPILARQGVRFVGEPVAVVVADDRYVAADAVDTWSSTTSRSTSCPSPAWRRWPTRAARRCSPRPRHQRLLLPAPPEADDRPRCSRPRPAGRGCDRRQQPLLPAPIEPRRCSPTGARPASRCGPPSQAPHHPPQQAATFFGIAQHECRVVAPRRRRRVRLEDRVYPEFFSRRAVASGWGRPVKFAQTRSEAISPDGRRPRSGARASRSASTATADPRPAPRGHPERRAPTPTTRPAWGSPSLTTRMAAGCTRSRGRRRSPSRDDQHHAGAAALPRRRPAGGDLPDRAHRSTGGRRDRPRPRRGAAPQLRRRRAFPYESPHDEPWYTTRATSPAALAECLRLPRLRRVRADQDRAQRRPGPSRCSASACRAGSRSPGSGQRLARGVRPHRLRGSRRRSRHPARRLGDHLRRVVAARPGPRVRRSPRSRRRAGHRLRPHPCATATPPPCSRASAPWARGVPARPARRQAGVAESVPAPRRSPPTCSRPATDDLEVADDAFNVAGTPARSVRGTRSPGPRSQPLSLPHEVQVGSLEAHLFREAPTSPTRPAPTPAWSRSTGTPARSPSSSSRWSTTAARSSTRCSPRGRSHGGVAQGIAQALYEEVAYSTGPAGHVEPHRLPRAVGGGPAQFMLGRTPRRPEQPARRQGHRRVRRGRRPAAVVNAVVDALAGGVDTSTCRSHRRRCGV